MHGQVETATSDPPFKVPTQEAPPATSDNNNFYYALGAIKNVGYEAISNIVSERIKNGKHRDVIYTNSETTASHCIKTGLGVAIIPESVAIDYKLLFRELVKPSIKRDIYFIYKDENRDKINFDTKALKNALWL